MICVLNPPSGQIFVLTGFFNFFSILEEDGLTGSLFALPLSVHGSASAQMQMVNTSKIGKQVCVKNIN